LSDAQGFITEGEGYLNDIAPALAAGEYGVAAEYETVGSLLTSVVPAEYLLIGAVEALGL
jgi:hypothetical protein